MASAKTWLLRVFGGLVAIVVFAMALIYVISSRRIAKPYAFREHPVTVPTDSAGLARGEHLARLSCYGCHGAALEGRVFLDLPRIARIVAPNAMEGLASYTDAEFAGFLRHGVHKDGTASFIMSPVGLYHMSDADLGALIAYLRRQPTGTTPALPKTSYRLVGRLGMVMGQFRNVVENRDTTVAPVGDDPAYATTRHGEYLARMMCANCHSPRLTGDPFSPSPSIAGAAGYSAAEFTALLREAKPRLSTTKLTLMAEVAKGELHLLHDDEIAALYGYLSSLPQAGVPNVK